MQTFIPEVRIFTCAKELDKKRLWKQVVEVYQILHVIQEKIALQGTNIKVTWSNHPACIAWQYNLNALAFYGIVFAQECIKRGIKAENMNLKIQSMYNPNETLMLPIWWGDSEIHSSHRYKLLQKAHETYAKTGKEDIILWYEQWKWEEAKDPNFMKYQYMWPIWTDNEGKKYQLELRGKK